MLAIIVGVLAAVWVLGFICARVLKGRNGLEAMYRPDAERAARQPADATLRE